LLITLGRDRFTDFNERWPEVIVILRAAAIMTWAELSLLWIRTALQPKTDVQQAATKALETPMAAAIVYATHSVNWIVRMVIFLKLCSFVQP
jgi:hypothetical protein